MSGWLKTGRRICGALAAGVMLAAGMSAAPAGASPDHHHARPAVQLGPAARDVGVLHVRARPRPRPQRPARPTEISWPAPGTGVAAAELPPGVVPPRTAPDRLGALLGAATSPALARAGRLPLYAAAPGAVSFRMLSHAAAAAAGIDGVLFTASTAGHGARARIGLSYARFGQVYGGGYGASLGMAVLPACVLTTPHVRSCDQAMPLHAVNDSRDQMVEAEVSLPASATVVMETAATVQDGGGSTGNYQAPAGANPSGTWVAGGSDGDFTYTYPMTVPPAAGGLQPDLALNYDSGAADAQTAQTAVQGSWAGDGWSLPQASISQSFTACADDPEGTASSVTTQDACYDGATFTLTLDGSTTPLVCPSAFTYSGTDTCYASDDSGEVVTHHGTSGNGQDYFGDYWTVTTRDGDTYYFGLNHLPGWASGDTATDSVDWEPVFSAHSTDPCYELTAKTFAGSACDMAYQWNEDYVTDAYGNAMAYFYTQYTNYYNQYDGSSTKVAEYIRDSELSKVIYGFTSGNAYSTAAATAPAAEAQFASTIRCFAGSTDCGSSPTSSTSSYWEDVPYNLICASTATSCAAGYGPTFFSTVALHTVTTYLRTGTATAPTTPVDLWTLQEQFSNTVAGDPSDVPSIELDSVARTGEDATSGVTTGSAVPLPPVSFTYDMLANQVDSGSAPSMSRPRLLTITTETGSVINVTYGLPDACPETTDPATPATNTTSCFPVYWGTFSPTTTNGGTGYPDWFNKYAVTQVYQSDPAGGSPGLTTTYAYDSPAWHYDDTPAVEAKDRTYGQWRGYQLVYTFTGSGSDPQTESSTAYYQGMSDDNDSTDITLPDSQTNQHEDADQLAGDVLETTTYDYATAPGSSYPPAQPPASSVDDSQVYSYWVSGNVASQTADGITLTANATGAAEEWTRQAITDTSTTTWRETATDTTYYSATSGDPELGLPEYAYSLGDLSQLSDPTEETCTTTSYITNSAGSMVLPSQTQTVALPCGGSNTGTASTPASGDLNALTAPSGIATSNIVSDTRTFYDDAALAATWPQPASSSITWPQSAPANPEVSAVQDATSYDSSTGTFTYQTSSAATYNAQGMPTGSYDGNGGEHLVGTTETYSPTSTSYTMTDGSVTAQTVTNPLGQATTTTYDPARGLPYVVTDPNGLATTFEYDELGRLASEWDYGRATSSKANEIYSYSIGAGTTPTMVTSEQLNDESGYEISTTLYDSLLRVRQTQDPTPQGGSLVTDDFYDSRGWLWKVNHDWWASANDPGAAEILTVPDSQVPDQTQTQYDALGRPVIVTDLSDSNIETVSYTDYTGDKVITVPSATGTDPVTPADATPTAVVTNAIGQTTEDDSYSAFPAVAPATNTGGFPTVAITGGTAEATDYTYNSNDQVSQITSGGEAWKRTYDMLGQVQSQTSPNAGTTSNMTYDADGNLIQSTDADSNVTTWTYDALGRKTGEYDGTSSSAPPIATWAYDNSNDAVSGMTDAIGELTTETSYDQNGQAWTIQQTGFNNFGESLGETITVPPDQGALAGTYTQGDAYTPTTGLLEDVDDPASPALSGGTSELPPEEITYSYSPGLDLLSTVASNLAGYTDSTTYTAFSQVGQVELGTASVNAFITNTYDPNTGNLTDTQVTNTAISSTPYDDTSYNYDPAGNITTETDTRNGTQTDEQCFGYSPLDQLTAAWTTDGTTSCSAGQPSASSDVTDGIAGLAYSDTWQYNALGDQTIETDNSVTGGTPTTIDYTYNDGAGTSTGQPNTLTSSTVNSGQPTTYGYDADGNTTSIDAPSGNQALTWTSDSKLSTDTTSAGTTSYIYDADGNLLATDDPTSDTLYLFGEQITATLNSQGTATAITGQRFISLPGGSQVVRTGTSSNFYFETGDQHGTKLLALNSSLQNPVWRQYTPYGNPRGTPTGTWPDTNGYLGDPVDANTGFTTIGARQYDPTTGRFLSLDPDFEAGDPNQMGGYAYAGDNPATFSDPTGLMYACEQAGGCQPISPGDQQAAQDYDTSTPSFSWGNPVDFLGGAAKVGLGVLSAVIHGEEASAGNYSAALQPNFADNLSAAISLHTDDTSLASDAGGFTANLAALLVPGADEADAASIVDGVAAEDAEGL
jgi:RHS repeat-associated protein